MSDSGSKGADQGSTGSVNRRSRASLTSVSSVLSKVIGRFGLEQRMKEHAFMSMWTEIVDQPFKELSRPLFIDSEGNLVVAVRDGAVAQELSFQRGRLLKRLSPFAKAVSLKLSGIRFDLKHFKESVPQDNDNKFALSLGRSPGQPLPSDSELCAIELSEDDCNEIEKLKLNLTTSAEQGDCDWQTQQRITKLYERELRMRLWREQKGFQSCTKCGYVDSRLYGANSYCRLCHVLALISPVS